MADIGTKALTRDRIWDLMNQIGVNVDGVSGTAANGGITGTSIPGTVMRIKH